jgi:serine/threonine protein kinase
VLDRRAPLPAETAVDYALQVCQALASAPALDVAQSEVRKTIGAPRYLAPERVRSGSVPDARSDIWSVGCVLYELLTGESPFGRGSLMQTCVAVLEQDPIALADLRDGLPEALRSTVARCLQKPSADRFADLSELGAALLPFGSGRYGRDLDRYRPQVSGEHSDLRNTPTAPVTSSDLASTVTRCRNINVTSQALRPTEPARQRPASRMATLAFDLTALTAAEQETSQLTVRSALTEPPGLAIQSADVGVAKRPATQVSTMALTAALLCTLGAGVMLFLSIMLERPEQPRLLHLVTPRQELSSTEDVTLAGSADEPATTAAARAQR